MCDSGLTTTTGSDAPVTHMRMRGVRGGGYVAGVPTSGSVRQPLSRTSAPPLPRGKDMTVHIIVQGSQKRFDVVTHTNESVEGLRDALFAQTGIRQGQQTLMFDNQPIYNGQYLKDFNIVSGSTIMMVLRTRGGSVAFNAPDVGKVSTSRTGKNDYHFYSVSAGLNYEVSPCSAEGCQARNEPQIINRGLGTFRPNEDTAEPLKCKGCNAPVDLKAMRFFRCHHTIEYRLVGKSKETIKGTVTGDEIKNFGRDTNGSTNDAEYTMLIITATALS